jgi:hypothetical protein
MGVEWKADSDIARGVDLEGHPVGGSCGRSRWGFGFLRGRFLRWIANWTEALMERSAIAVVEWILGWQIGGGLARGVPLASGDAHLCLVQRRHFNMWPKNLDLIEGRGNNIDSLK